MSRPAYRPLPKIPRQYDGAELSLLSIGHRSHAFRNPGAKPRPENNGCVPFQGSYGVRGNGTRNGLTCWASLPNSLQRAGSLGVQRNTRKRRVSPSPNCPRFLTWKRLV